ncbi:hypothetical protein GOODEAATRI_031309, partial [Goodea atripinnis]
KHFQPLLSVKMRLWFWVFVFYVLRERPVNQPTELLHPQADVAKHMPLGGSDEVLTNGLKPDLQAAKRLAKRLYNLDGFRKSDVARHLSKKSVCVPVTVNSSNYSSECDFGHVFPSLSQFFGLIV